MAYCINYNCDPLGDHTPNECAEELLGGSSAVVAVECGNNDLDPSDGVAVQALIDSGQAKLIEGVKVSIEAGSPVEAESNIGCGIPKVINYERQGTYIDGNVNAANVDFYNTIFGGRPIGGLIIYECGTEEATTPQVTYINSEIRFTGDRILPASNTEFQRFEAAFKWRSKTMPTIHAVPAGIFN